jgi:carbon starvation protein
MLVKLARPVWFTILPMCALLVMTVMALLYQLWGFAMAGNYFLVFLDLVILAASILVILEAVSAFNRERRLVRPAVAR